MAKQRFQDFNFRADTLAMIKQANTILAEYARQGYDLSLRQLYYQFVSRDLLANNDRNYKRLGSVINDARLAGLVDWSMIRDRGRVLVGNAHWENPGEILTASANQFRIEKWRDQPCHVEVMVEKQALEGVLIPVCRRLDIDFIANKGYSSASAMYTAGKRLKHAMDTGKEVHILYLGDHDPSGIDMTRDVRERLEIFTGYSWWDEDEREFYTSEQYEEDQLGVDRLALNFDQVQEYNPPPNPTKKADSRANAYIRRFGETCWELDALRPEVLAQLVEDAVAQYRDDALWEASLARENEMKDRLLAYAAEWQG